MKYLTWKNAGLLISIIVFLMLGMSGYSKVVGSDEMVGNFTAMNLLPYMKHIGILEILSCIMLVYPKTTKWGALLISCLMSGAVTVHLSYFGGANLMIPVMLGLLAWTGHCLRNYTIK